MGKPTKVLSCKIDEESDDDIERARVVDGRTVYDRTAVVRRVLKLAKREGLFGRLLEVSGVDVDAGEEAGA